MMEEKTIIFLSALIFLACWNIVLTYFLFKIIRKNKTFFSLKSGTDIYKTINGYLEKSRQVEIKGEEIKKEIEKTNKDFSSCLQKVGVIRYNPFKEIGGDQSFSIALLNQDDDGVIITSIQSRQGNRAYAKLIKAKKSEYNLSTEEIEAIILANKK